MAYSGEKKIMCCRVGVVVGEGGNSYLDEANVGTLLTEALTADVEAVLADETGLVGADTAVRSNVSQVSLILMPCSPRSDLVDHDLGIFFPFLSLLSSRGNRGASYQARAPLPYLRGREFQTDS